MRRPAHAPCNPYSVRHYGGWGWCPLGFIFQLAPSTHAHKILLLSFFALRSSTTHFQGRGLVSPDAFLRNAISGLECRPFTSALAMMTPLQREGKRGMHHSEFSTSWPRAACRMGNPLPAGLADKQAGPAGRENAANQLNVEAHLKRRERRNALTASGLPGSWLRERGRHVGRTI